jgi:tricorn protease
MRALHVLLGTLVFAFPLHAAETGYYRQPAIHGSTVVFVAEGDLWSVPLAGGRATRLTTHPDSEGSPAISPDGKQLAFTARYEGSTDVYVMPLSGGRPRRLTFDGANISSVGWTPDGKILVGTNAHAGLPNQQLLVIDPGKGGVVTRTQVPLAQAAEGCFSKDGKTLFFTRQDFQGSSTRRYKGGTAQQLWSFRTGDPEAKPLTTSYAGTSKSPQFWQDRVYFASDRDGVMNLWSIKPDGSDPKQHTKHKDYDIATPALEGGRVVYQIGADLRVYDIAANSDKAIPTVLDSDFDHTREKWIKEPVDFLSSAHSSPDGAKAVVTARGRVFVIPRKGGRLVEAARKPGVRYRDARFMPDGKSLLAFSDESGEVELWTLSADGEDAPSKLTDNGLVLRRKAVPSPDGKYVAHTDKNQRLFLLNMTGRENKKLAESAVDEFDDMAWSPDSKWLAYTEVGDNLFRRVVLYSIATGTTSRLTTDRFDSYSPVFSPDGKWLYLLSDRNLKSTVKSPWGTYQPEPFFEKKTKIYQISLVAGTRSPFTPPTELEPEPKEDKKDEKESKTPTVTIELNGIATRLIPVPVPAGNYKALAVNDKALFWMKMSPDEEQKGTLEGATITTEELEVKTIAEKVKSFELSGDGKKLLIVQDKELVLADAAVDKPDSKKSGVELKGWTFSIDPREEWRQMFHEAWRLERDYFYDRGHAWTRLARHATQV